MARSVYRGIRASYDQPYALMPAMQTNIGLHLFTGLLLMLPWLRRVRVDQTGPSKPESDARVEGLPAAASD